MNILWFGKRPVNNPPTGEEIYDRKLIAACRALGHTVDVIHPDPVGRVGEVRNMLLGVPYQRARFATPGNSGKLAGGVTANYDFAVCSWEPLDGLGRALPIPTLLITHNISSRALPALFPRSLLARLAAARAGVWEGKTYQRAHYHAVGALSKRDLSYLQSLGAPRPVWLPPGMPPLCALRDDVVFRPELVISGTFDWAPKRRDLLRFAADYEAHKVGIPVLADALPPEAVTRLAPGPLPDSSDAIRVGVITDRFEAGHKLKTLAYIASNQIVFSFADVGFDFDHIPDSAFFIRRVASVDEIPNHMRDLSAMPGDALRDRLRRFQRNCASAFTWNRLAVTVTRVMVQRGKHAASDAARELDPLFLERV